jgi:cytochrome c-type biogenesis protein CcmH
LSAAVRSSARLLPGAAAATAGWTAAQTPTGEVADLLARAEDHRRKREFAQACAVYAAVVARGGMTADGWADYADAQASINGRLAGEPARYIAAALALDPQHAKALWLQASLAHEERRYSDALATWRRLQAVVPPDSSDARIVEANIVEAARLASS